MYSIIFYIIIFFAPFINLLSYEKRSTDEDTPRFVKKYAFSPDKPTPTTKPDEVIDLLSNEFSCIVNGCVNAMSGNYIEQTVDLYLGGPLPLSIERTYCSDSGWSLHNAEYINTSYKASPCDKEKSIVHFNQGSQTYYYPNKNKNYHIEGRHYSYGLTNLSSKKISGSTNPRNLSFTIDKKLKHAVLVDGAGTKKHFDHDLHDDFKHQKKRSFLSLSKIEFINGCKTLIDYQSSDLGWNHEKITNFNSSSQPLNSAVFKYHKINKLPFLTITANDGRQCFYSFTYGQNEFDYLVDTAIGVNSISTRYIYNKNDKLIQRLMPNDRTQEIAYYSFGSNDLGAFGTMKVRKGNQYIENRVLGLKAPVGTDKTLYYTHLFNYEKNYNFTKDRKKYFIAGKTTVFDAHNNPTVYHYNNCYRLDYIANYLNGNLYRQQNSFWAKNNTDLYGNILCRTLTDANGTIHSSISYEYDPQGNVLREHFSGCLTGTNPTQVTMKTESYPDYTDCDVFTRHYTYSDDGLNLLLTETDLRKKISYCYFPGTNLLTTKITSVNHMICAREFYDYDENRLIVCKISDDGNALHREDLTGVTERHITRTHYRGSTPIGLPQVVEEKYLDLITQQEILLKKTANEHTLTGDIIAQHHYDANDNLTYTLRWAYDEKNRLTTEVDVLGNFTSYSYDQNNNLIFERHAGDDYHTEHTYDYSNRLIQSINVHDAGVRLTKRYAYDKLNQMIESVDWYGNTTNYFYDTCGRLISVSYPAIPDEQGNFNRPQEHYRYDIANNPIEIIDARGFTKKSLYTSRGQAYYEEHPDGYNIRNYYSLDGLLEKSISSKGTTTETVYDYQGRPLTTTVTAPTGEILSNTHKKYNHFHLLHEIDTLGNQTNYSYDNAGRLTLMTKDSSKITYHYDALQRLNCVRHYFGLNINDFIAKISAYDVKNQIIEERTEDAEGNILEKIGYAYDLKGNREYIKRYHLADESVSITNYNAYGEINYTIDPLGHTTKCIYHYGHFNEHGQCVLQLETIDPIGNSTFTEYTSNGLVRKIFKKDLMGKIIQKTIYSYDLCNNCVKQEHTVISDKEDKIIINLLAYNAFNAVVNITESANTIENKTTRYEYNQHREKISVIKMDGTTLLHTYDYVGRLSEFKASDNSFSYAYTYDANSNVIKVDDLINNCSTFRSYNSCNKLVSEIQSNGLQIGYTYDIMGRLIEVVLPDHSSIQYVYKSNQLHQVKRNEYTHTYQQHNLSGLLEKSKMIGNTGNLSQSWDALGRLELIKTPFWSENIPKDGFDPVGNVIKKDLLDLAGKVNQEFNYDSLYQLTLESGVTSHQFENDSLNNVIKKDDCVHEVNNLNQLLNDGKECYVYDLRGNLIKKGEINFCYDALDRLISIHTSNLDIVYSYDELNRRMNKLVKNKTTGKKLLDRYLYQGNDEIGAVDENGVIQELRVLGSGKKAEMGASVMIELQKKIFAPVHDLYGNITALVDAKSGELKEFYRYSAYGEEEIYNDQSIKTDKSINPWRFSSKRIDDETGFIYFGCRYFFPKICRWITADPLGFEAGPNLYAYVHNNPLKLLDLYGLAAVNNTAFQTMFNTAAKISCFAGEVIDTLAHHIIPIPLVKDILQFPAHCLKGGTVSDYVPSYSRDHSCYELIGKGKPGSKSNFIDGNGICTSKEESFARAKKIYDEMGGKETVYAFHNGTQGAVADIIESGLNIIGVPTNVTEVFKKCVMEARVDLGHEGTTFINVHSQASLVALDASRTLDKSVRSNIDIYTIGAPIALSEGAYGDVINYAASYDFVTFGTRSYNTLKKSITGTSTTISVLSTQGGYLRAHDYDGNTYSLSNKQRIQYIKKART